MTLLTRPDGCVPGSRWRRAALWCRASLLLIGLAVLLSGCARLPIAGPDATRLNATAVARLDDAALFAAAPGGKQVAFSSGGVWVAPLPGGDSRPISTEPPLALAWSPDGERLAVAFAGGSGSRIAVFGPDGAMAAETAIAGRAIALSWSAADTLLVVALELEQYKFGASYREVLLTWHLTAPPERAVLHDVTLKPSTVRRLESGLLTRVLSPLFSPLGDELLYGRIMDPPAFDAHLKIMLRNIASGAEREVASTAFTDGTVRFAADGEDLFVAMDTDKIRRIAAWSGTEKQLLPFSGRALAVSPDGRHLLADGRLLQNGRETARFPALTTGLFVDDGRLLAAYDGTLFLVSGLGEPVAAPAMPPGKLERLRTLRAWRASGLISADEYVAAREKVMR